MGVREELASVSSRPDTGYGFKGIAEMIDRVKAEIPRDGLGRRVQTEHFHGMINLEPHQRFRRRCVQNIVKSPIQAGLAC